MPRVVEVLDKDVVRNLYTVQVYGCNIEQLREVFSSMKPTFLSLYEGNVLVLGSSSEDWEGTSCKLYECLRMRGIRWNKHFQLHSLDMFPIPNTTTIRLTLVW